MFTVITPFGEIYVRGNGRPYDRSALPEAYRDVIQFDLSRLEAFFNANHAILPNEIDVNSIGHWTETGYHDPVNDPYHVLVRVVDEELWETM